MRKTSKQIRARAEIARSGALAPAVVMGFTLAVPVWAQTGEEGARNASVVGKGEAHSLETIEVTGKRRTTLLSKMADSLREVPQSLSVISGERLELQNLYNLEDAIRQAPGVTLERIDATRFNVYSRGFEIDKLLVDGLPTTMDDRIFLAPELAQYERVEILKGPAGLLSGAGGAGGALNLVRKRAEPHFAASSELAAGSWDNYRGSIDVTGPLSEQGDVRGRLGGSYQDREFFYDVAEQESWVLYGNIEYELTPDTLLSAGGSYQEVDARAPWTLPGTNDYRLLDVSRSTFLGADWNRDRYDTASVFAELVHEFDNDWSVKLAARRGESGLDRVQAYAWGAVDPQQGTTDVYSLKEDYEEKQTGIDAYATGPFTLAGREHKLLIGVNREDVELEQPNFKAKQGDPAIIDPLYDQIDISLDVFNPVSDIPQPEFVRNGGNVWETKQLGLYGNAQFSLTDPLTLVLGGRVTRWEQTLNGTESGDFDAEFTPLVGAIYDLNDTYSVYTSYAEIFRPQNAVDMADELIDPLEGKQYEAGIKGVFMDDALNVSLAVFRIYEENRAQADINDPSGDASVAQGRARSQGLEAEAFGQVLPGWEVQASYTYTHTKNLDESENEGAAFTAIAPRHILRLWTHYQLPGQWEQWRFSAGVNAVSEFYNEFGDAPRFGQSGYATVDASVGYQLSPKLALDLSITNLFDKEYYQRISTPNSGNLFGEPRAAKLTLRAKF